MKNLMEIYKSMSDADKRALKDLQVQEAMRLGKTSTTDVKLTDLLRDLTPDEGPQSQAA